MIICSPFCLKQHNWTPVKVVDLPNNIPPYRFAGHSIHALLRVCLVVAANEINGTAQKLHIFSFLVPDVPSRFLLPLQDQRPLVFDVCPYHGHASHLKLSIGTVFTILR